MKKVVLSIDGMTCSACSNGLEKYLNKQNGIKSATVNLVMANALIEYDENILNLETLEKFVEEAGFKSLGIYNENSEKKQNKNEKVKFIIFSVLAVALMYISMGHMMGWPLPSSLLGMENAISFAFTQFLLLIPVVFITFTYYRMGFKTLFHGSPNMDSLIAIGSSAAIVYGIYAIYKIGIGFGHGDMATVHSFMMDLYFESAGMILTLITLGKTLEARAKGKTSDAITKLMNLAPKTAVVERNGQEITIPVEEVQAGETLIVKAGEAVPVVGVVVEDASSVDESALTGESIPV